MVSEQTKAAKARIFHLLQLGHAAARWVTESKKKALLMQESSLMTKMFQTKVRIGLESSALRGLNHIAQQVAFRAKVIAIVAWKQGLAMHREVQGRLSAQRAWRMEALKGLVLASNRIKQQAIAMKLQTWRCNLQQSLEVATLMNHQEAQRAAAAESEWAMRNCLSSVQARIETVYSFSQRSGLRCLQNILRLRLLAASGSALLRWRHNAELRMTNLPMRMHTVTSVLFGFDRLIYRRTRGEFRKAIRVWQAKSWSSIVKASAGSPRDEKQLHASLSKTRLPLSPVTSPVKSPVKSPTKPAVISPKKVRTMLGDMNHLASDVRASEVQTMKAVPQTAAERVKAQADIISQLLTTSARSGSVHLPSQGHRPMAKSRGLLR